MTIQFIVVGKTDGKYFNEAIDDYRNRLRRYTRFEMEVIPELRNARNLTFAQQKEREADLILKALQPGDYVVLLDERGREMTSTAFADYLERKQQTVARRLVFIVGGPYGFSDRVYDVASEKLSLSQMTFSHQMIRLFFVEQVYRAFTIMRGEPYHHE
jgi:23S rRNA (pseudouridine1915-N3)-methyltransferase